MLLNFKFNKRWYYISEIILGMSVLITFIISIIGYTDIGFSIRALNEITNSWELSPILDLSSSDYTGCKNSTTPLITDEWVGTVAGCDCLGVWSDYVPWQYQNTVNRGVCDFNMSSGGCVDVSAINPVDFNIWRSSFLCATKMNSNYSTLYRNAQGTSCKSGYKQCGVLDTIGNLLCIPTADKCPINKILIQSTVPYDYNYTAVSLGTNKTLYYTNEAVLENVLVEVRVSEGDVCLDSAEHNTNFPGKSYILEHDFNNYGCGFKISNTTTDPRFEQIDSYLKRQVFIDNGIYNLIQRLPQYPFNNLNTTLQMFIRPYIGWKFVSSETSGSDLGVIGVMVDTLILIRSLKLTNMIIFIIVFVYFFCQVFLKWKSVRLFNILESIFVILSIANLILSIFSLRKNQFSLDFENFNYGDNITNSLFNSFGNMLRATGGKDIGLVILSLVNSLTYPLLLFLNWSNSNKEINYFTNPSRM